VPSVPVDDRPYGIIVAGPAARAIAELPEAVAAAVIDLIAGALLDNPHRVGKPLRHELEGIHSARRGTFRILYRIDETHHEVLVLTVESRGSVYRRR
jgi:mRNA interferase RelE/StbE